MPDVPSYWRSAPAFVDRLTAIIDASNDAINMLHEPGVFHRLAVEHHAERLATIRKIASRLLDELSAPIERAKMEQGRVNTVRLEEAPVSPVSCH